MYYTLGKRLLNFSTSQLDRIGAQKLGSIFDMVYFRFSTSIYNAQQKQYEAEKENKIIREWW